MALFIRSEGHSPLIPLLGCETFHYPSPIGLTVSHDGRVYICDMTAPMQVQETNGSHSEFSLHPGPNGGPFSGNVYSARICCDGGIIVCDEAGNLDKYSKDGEFKRRIGENPSEPGVTCIQKFFIDSSDMIYVPYETQIVKVYLSDGTFSHDLVLESDCESTGIAVDCDKNIHLGCKASIKVFNSQGKLIHEYGHKELREVENIAISTDNPQLVVATEYESSKLFVFNSTGTFLYTVTGVACICDITFGPDNSLWIAEWEAHHFGIVLHIPKLFRQLPPPLSYLCELSILSHLNELPVSLLPPRLAGLFEKWTRLVTVEVRRKSFTDYPSKSKLLSETTEFKVEPNASREIIQWLVSKRMDLKYSAISISRSRDDCVDFVATEREARC